MKRKLLVALGMLVVLALLLDLVWPLALWKVIAMLAATVPLWWFYGVILRRLYRRSRRTVVRIAQFGIAMVATAAGMAAFFGVFMPSLRPGDWLGALFAFAICLTPAYGILQDGERFAGRVVAIIAREPRSEGDAS